MIKNMFKIPNWQKLLVTAIFLYSTYSSLVQGGKLGLIPIVVLIFYFLLSIHYKDAHKISFIMSLVLMVLAVALYVLDITNAWYAPITKLSEWAYLILLVGAVQLTCLNKIGKK